MKASRFITKLLDSLYHNSPSAYYRGVSDTEHRLLPTIGRHPHLDGSGLLNLEQQLLKEFKRCSPPYLPRLPSSEFEWLLIAQHYGIPTRLLDWTTNPLVALYFAVCSSPDKPGCIYSIHNIEVIDRPTERDPFDIEGPSAVFPTLIDQRVSNQAGLFTIQRNPCQPLTHETIKTIVIDRALKEDVKCWLRWVGITTSFLFPSLTSLASELKMEYGFSR